MNPLSKILHSIAIYTGSDKQARLHNKSHYRLKNLIEKDETRKDEYMLIRNACLGLHLNGKRTYLIAVEYDIDDGGRHQGRGDALLYDGETLYVLECKFVLRNPGYTLKREHDVQIQAKQYATRLRSWINHLLQFDENYVF